MATKPSKKANSTTSAKKGTSQPATSITPIAQAAKSAETHMGEFQRAQQRIEEEIRVRAYELFEGRGRQEGHDREDWARAEDEVLAKYQRVKSA